jgi:archaellum component FlaF (FlaF/FlaG flagellin family)
METVITAVIMISLLVLLVFGVAQHLLASQAVISDSSRVMEERLSDRARTNLTSVNATVTPINGSTDSVNVTVKNTGSVKLSDFQQWDVILQYTAADNSSQVKWYAYPTEWTAQIYQSISPNVAEVIQPG